MSITLQDIKTAQARIAPYVVRTPLLRMQNLDRFLGCQVYAKAECMQNTGSFKLRGAMNKILSLTPEEVGRGIVAASSGNHGKAVAYAAKLLGTTAAIVMPNTAPSIKVEAIRALGAEVVQCDASQRFLLAEELCQKRGCTMVPPFDDDEVMAGQGTTGLEIMDQCPDLDYVIVPTSGGGLIGGVSTAVKSIRPETKVIGAEPAALPRYSTSLAAGEPVTVPQQRTLADALVSQRPGLKNFPIVQAHTDGFIPVSDEFLLKGMKLLLTEGKLLAEPSSCIGLGALLQGSLSVKANDKVCLIISGGSVGLEQLRILEDVTV